MDFFPTVEDIVDAALKVVGAIDPEGGVTPTTTQRNDAMEALNFLITSWQAHGMQVWKQKQFNTNLLASTANYTIGSGGLITENPPVTVQRAWLRDTDATPDIDIPIRMIGREEYNRISQKLSEGVPNCAFYDRTYDQSGSTFETTLYLWPVPDTATASRYDIYFVGTSPLDDHTLTSELVDFPPEWMNALKWNLALALCPEYEVPSQKWDRIARMATDAFNLASGSDTEWVSTTIAPANA